LARLDVLVHSSLTPGPFGQVVLEGMQAGLCVIAAGAGGPAEILDHERTGLLYAPGSVDALAAAMRRAIDHDLRSQLGAAAQDALDPYRPHVVADPLQRLYDDLAAHRRPSPRRDKHAK
jgi:glycosyltransferase involved in cell wall biosynthesis